MALKVLLVDDEALARMRLRDLLADCNEPVTELGRAPIRKRLGAHLRDTVILYNSLISLRLMNHRHLHIMTLNRPQSILHSSSNSLNGTDAICFF